MPGATLSGERLRANARFLLLSDIQPLAMAALPREDPECIPPKGIELADGHHWVSFLV